MNHTPLLQAHEAAGARLTGEAGSQQVLTFGDVPAEYAAAQSGCAIFDETQRGMVEVVGGERAVFLHRLLSNEVRSLTPGQGCRSLLLSSKGKVLFDIDLAVEAEQIRLSTPPGDSARLLQALDMYLFTEDVRLRDASEEYAAIDLSGPRQAEVAAAVLGSLGALHEPPEAPAHATRSMSFQGEPLRLCAQPVAGSPGLRLEFDPQQALPLWNALCEAGARPAGLVVHDSLRCEAGYGRWGVDVSDAVYPQEARLEPAFSLEKGCYIGQEVVAKIDTYGGLNKRLLALAVSHDDPVPAGTRLYRQDEGEWRDLGVVTSWAYSFALDGGLVLAYLKRHHQAPETLFRLGEGPEEAQVVSLPLRAGALHLPGELEEPQLP